MTKEEFFKTIEEYQEHGRTLIKLKNADYSSGDDPFKNFKVCKHIGISPERGVLVRMMDKICRAGSLIDKEAAVANERIEDTLIDLANYAYILLAMLKDNKGK